MKIREMFCPACGYPLPEGTQPNQLVTCPACNATLFMSDWQVGQAEGAVVVATPTRVYTVTDLLAKDDLCSVYRCRYKIDGEDRQGMFRIARDPGDNDLVKNEAQTLYHFQSVDNYDTFSPFLPLVLESFLYQDTATGSARQVNILGFHEQITAPNELYSLEEVHDYYLNGIDARDMAWMWRRLAYILGFVHAGAVVHGAVLPSHVLIEPKDHKLVLAGWGFSVRSPAQSKNTLKALSLSYESWYPDEVRQKVPPTPGLDLLMAARCMLYLVGADPLSEPKHRSLEPPLQQYFARCVSANPHSRPQDSWKLLDEFDRVIEQLWGPRQFRVFTMPYKA